MYIFQLNIVILLMTLVAYPPTCSAVKNTHPADNLKVLQEPAKASDVLAKIPGTPAKPPEESLKTAEVNQKQVQREIAPPSGDAITTVSWATACLAQIGMLGATIAAILGLFRVLKDNWEKLDVGTPLPEWKSTVYTRKSTTALASSLVNQMLRKRPSADSCDKLLDEPADASNQGTQASEKARDDDVEPEVPPKSLGDFLRRLEAGDSVSTGSRVVSKASSWSSPSSPEHPWAL